MEVITVGLSLAQAAGPGISWELLFRHLFSHHSVSAFFPPGEIALLEGLTVVYKSSIDLYFYVIGSSYENELMLMAVLNCLFDSLSQMLRKNVEKRALLENMEGLFLAVDEIVDGG